MSTSFAFVFPTQNDPTLLLTWVGASGFSSRHAFIQRWSQAWSQCCCFLTRPLFLQALIWAQQCNIHKRIIHTFINLRPCYLYGNHCPFFSALIPHSIILLCPDCPEPCLERASFVWGSHHIQVAPPLIQHWLQSFQQHFKCRR